MFDATIDTYDALHDRSPFAVNCICMVAARVRDGGGRISLISPRRCLCSRIIYRQSQRNLPQMSRRSSNVILRYTILSCGPPGGCSGYECVERNIVWRIGVLHLSFSLVLVSGWSDNGWLSGGHAVRMAMEICWLHHFESRYFY